MRQDQADRLAELAALGSLPGLMNVFDAPDAVYWTVAPLVYVVLLYRLCQSIGEYRQVRRRLMKRFEDPPNV